MTKDPLEGIFSPETRKKIQEVSPLKQFFEGGMSRTDYDAGIDKIADLLATDVDAADGKDGKVKRTTILAKLKALSEADGIGYDAKSRSMFKKMHDFCEKFAPAEVSRENVKTQIKFYFQKGTDQLFEFDVNKDGIVSKEELNPPPKSGKATHSR